MADLIERRAAYTFLTEYYNHRTELQHKNLKEALSRVPSAQPERKTGMWNIIQGNIVVCSECGMGAPKTMTGCLVNRHLEPNRTNFCPNCGAKMEVKNE